MIASQPERPREKARAVVIRLLRIAFGEVMPLGRVGQSREFRGRYTWMAQSVSSASGVLVDLGDLYFQSDAEVAAEEAARFRAATPAERMRAIRSALAGGAVLIARSPKRAFLEAYRQRQEDLARESIAQFVVRHAGTS